MNRVFSKKAAIDKMGPEQRRWHDMPRQQKITMLRLIIAGYPDGHCDKKYYIEQLKELEANNDIRHLA